MPTTRHHLNSARRRQTREALRPPADTSGLRDTAHVPPATQAVKAREAVHTPPADEATRSRASERDPVTANASRRRGIRRTPAATDAVKGRREPRDQPQPNSTLAILCLLTLLLGGFAGWAHARAENLRDTPAARNTALSDTARTSEIKGQSTKAVAALFSYDHADPDAFDKAAKEWLAGRAIAQHRDLLGDIRDRADKQKAVITTTVTDSAVERIDGDRARVLVYADQSSVSTAGDKKAHDDGAYAGAMFAVDVQRRDGRWLVSRIDTFSR